MPIKDLIISRLKKYFAYDNTSPVIIEVVDTSSVHSGHSEIRETNSLETHFDILIVSDKFIDSTLIERHRIVYSILNDILGSKIHALSIDAYTYSEYTLNNIKIRKID